MFLAGGGIAEELVHRLVLLSIVWALTKRPWFAILVAAIIHSAYHFTPVNLLHETFLQFPVSQFLSGLVMGVWWGYVFVKRGYETAALGHTLSDWLPLLIIR
jgi:membrane protease YdiL (CAAX protease family)